MILPETYLTVLLVTILSVLCWGSWANTYKLAGKWRFELYYFDFALGLLAMSILLAFTLGNLGFDGFSFVDDFMHAGKREWLFGFMGGVVFNLANMLLLAAIAVAGMAVAFPVGLGVALLLVVLVNWFLKPPGNPMPLAGGCLLILGAIVIDSMAYGMLRRLRHEALAKAGKVASLRRPGAFKAVVISAVSGLLMGAFFPLMAKAQEGDIGLGPYAVTLTFALGAFVSTFVFNLFFMNLPVEGDPVEFPDYFLGTAAQHLWGLLGGAMWCGGAVAAFAAAAAPTQLNFSRASYLALGSALVAALWGLLAWREFKGSDLRVKLLLVVMLVLFVCGLAMLLLASIAH